MRGCGLEDCREGLGGTIVAGHGCDRMFAGLWGEGERPMVPHRGDVRIRRENMAELFFYLRKISKVSLLRKYLVAPLLCYIKCYIHLVTVT